MTLLNFDWFKKLFGVIMPEQEAAVQSAPAYAPLEYPAIFGPSIWAVGGGKGGVGKSLIASNIGILLSMQGRRVLLVDADLGAANLHTFLGVEGGRTALSSFLKGEVSDLSMTMVKTNMPNLDLISGSADSLDVADVNGHKIMRLKEALRKTEYDNVILDIGPGTSSNLLDLFLISSEGIILATPEPTTIENNYRFLKCLFLRKIKTVADAQEDGRLKNILQKVFSDRWSQRVKTVSDIIEQISRADIEQGSLLRGYIANTGISMILNQARKNEDDSIGTGIRKACSEYFGIDIGYLGSVGYEDCVNESIRCRRPLVVNYKQSSAAKSIEACLSQLQCRLSASKQNNQNGFLI